LSDENAQGHVGDSARQSRPGDNRYREGINGIFREWVDGWGI
jgi:hypothetical protein